MLVEHAKTKALRHLTRHFNTSTVTSRRVSPPKPEHHNLSCPSRLFRAQFYMSQPRLQSKPVLSLSTFDSAVKNILE